MLQVHEGERAAYYRAALQCLRFVEQRRPTGRRFGADADARWSSFKGDLTTADRIDLLIRDADAEWPGAFGPRTVYALRAVAEDEPFGAEWRPMDPVDAEELWRGLAQDAEPGSVADALRAMAAAWELELQSVEVGAVTPTDKIIVVGPSAIAALVAAFAAGSDLDWADQVVAVATPPAHRHLATAAVALLNSAKPARLVAASGGGAAAGSEGEAQQVKGARLLASADADAADRALAESLVGA